MSFILYSSNCSPYCQFNFAKKHSPVMYSVPRTMVYEIPSRW